MKDLKFYILGATILLVFYLMAQYNRPKALDWTETLSNTDKIPFGTYVLYNRVTDVFPGASVTAYREPVYNVVTNSKAKNATYIIINNVVVLNEYDYDKLTQYIKKGNDVFIAAEIFGTYLNKKLKISTSAEPQTADPIRIGFVSRYLNTYKYAVDKGCTDRYFSKFDTAQAVVIGKNENEHSNYLKFSMGKGNLYLNSNPLMFSNYSILQDQGAAYVPIALSYLKNNGSLLWDEYYSRGRDGESDSSLRVFIRNSSLRAALYIALFSLLFFVIYEAKRRQRIIPVIEPLRNSTLEFVNVVGQVYYEQRNNSNIATKKVTYFLEHLRSKYGLKTNVLNEEFLTLLAQKSGVDTALLHELLRQITFVRSNAPVNDSELIALNKNIEQFYSQSR
ncbi:uncharacterized protein DUF4350 [Mucilaginibacter gracilis]|uniref:Uncharacterized protein DUF4350 n=1 Tax=Mucilaginibacter gracilis TaxID=423350 RepID=A0A495J9D4_9SPHI|nr:DUF4350 domain-containing protein [Mucilaginibacter gracilis]RKR85626.1 uncharacterized protein DUF4350 [Mucilaginibacter gracilis]